MRNLLALFILAVLAGCTPEVKTVKYDFSTPEKSFLSLQQALRIGDIDNISIHSRQTMLLCMGAGSDAPAEAVKYLTEVKPDSSWKQLDSTVVEFSDLKLSDAKIVEIGKPKEFEPEGNIKVDALVVGIKIKWASGETADDVMAISGDSGKTWWCGAIFFTGVHP
jgi:hypothetical protein